MTKFILPLFLFFSFLAFSCKKEASEKKENITQSFNVKLNLGGELSVSESLLSTSGTITVPRSVSTNDLLGVYILAKKDGENTYLDYAYGLFDNSNSINITMLAGYKYQIIASVVIDGKNRIKKTGESYGHPFNVALENKIIYSNSFGLYGIYRGPAKIGTELFVGVPNVDRYYGAVSDFTPGQSNSSISINLKRVVFGAKFIVQNLTNGRVEIQIIGSQYGSNKIIIDKNMEPKIHEDIYTFFNPSGVIDWINDGYTEQMEVWVNWVNDAGIEANIAKQPVTFKRKTLTTITIKMTDGSSSSSSNSLSINMEPASPLNDGGNINIVQ
ncbi:MAG TPA: hypothetical protein PKY86_04105 [Niabella sp.]|nr:hypothetical protein [Niabella sp.]HQW14573.1 hypothetical protein [Niabella sp.]HQX19714.1 hypothetical protein [Niabella sp.]HRB07549.1 hypothetical protein [Niabella sp.]HRB35809.1 hypothetical protein [Niabella sp.]